MTHPTITCERFNEQLADFLERAVSEPMRAAMESHAVGCDDCGPLLTDLRRLRIDAANLPELTPRRDLWSGIADRIEAPVVSLPGARGARRRSWSNPIFVSLAAAGLVAITATITHRMDGGPVDRSTGGPQTNSAQRPAPTQSSPTVASADSTPQPTRAPAVTGPPVRRSTGQPASPVRLATNRPSAEQTYDREISRLLVVYNQRRPALDSTTIAVVRKNLKIIDEAIAQTKTALRRDPASQFLMESLNDEFDTKVQLLRKVAMLPSGT
jgi:hypothetical protein